MPHLPTPPAFRCMKPPRRKSLDPAFTAAMLQTARAALFAGRYAEAESSCRRLLQAEPTNVAALHLLASLAMREGKLAQALRLLVRALDV